MKQDVLKIEIQDKINKLRKELEDMCALNPILTCEQNVKLSQELDRMIIQYYRTDMLKQVVSGV